MDDLVDLVILNEYVTVLGQLGISQSISLPTIPAEPFFPSRPFQVRMATGQGYDDMLRASGY